MAGMINSGKPTRFALSQGAAPPLARVVSAGLVLAGLGLLLLADTGNLFWPRLPLLCLVLVLDVGAVLLWLLATRQAQLSYYASITLVAAAISLGPLWLQRPEPLMLVGLPVLLAMASSGLASAAVTALGEMVLVLLASWWSPGTLSPQWVPWALVSIGSTLGLLLAVHHPTQQLVGWAWQQFAQAQTLLEETRDRKAELEQALTNLMHANRQLMLLNEKMAGLRRLAEEAQNAKALFVAKVSHELRTPLNIIISLIDLLIETPEVYGEPLPPLLFEDLSIVHRNCEHLSHLINDVLDLSQAEAGQLTLQRRGTDLPSTVEQAIDAVRPLVEKKKLALHVNLPSTLPSIYCDPHRTRQVLLNLVSNAVRYTEQGAITVTVAPGGHDSLLVSVADTGIGIAPEQAVHLFEPFYQGTNAQGGYGLGLSISKTIIELQGGRMWFESTPGIGSAFFFTLPLAAASAPPAGPAQWLREDWMWHERPNRRATPKLPFQERVVVVDQTGELCTHFRHVADEIEFVDTNNLAAALPEIAHCPAHLLIINAPSVDSGNRLAEQAACAAVDTPIVVCSFQAQEQTAHVAGAAGYLIKPVLGEQLRQLIASIQPPPQRILLVDDDPDFRRLLRRMLGVYAPDADVTVATSGAEALAMLAAQPPDLMFLDLMLPDMSGWQVLAAKRNNPAHCAVPVFIVSAQDAAERLLTSPHLCVTFGMGISVTKTLHGALHLAALLTRPEPAPGPTPG